MILIIAKESLSSSAYKFCMFLNEYRTIHSKVIYPEPYECYVKHPDYLNVPNENKIDFKLFYQDEESKILEYYDRKSKSKNYLFENLNEQESVILKRFLLNHPSQIWKETGRFYLKKININDVCAYYDMLAGYYDSVISKYGVKLVFDFYPENVSRLVFGIICKRHNIKYISLIHSRFENYFVLCDDLFSIKRSVIKLKSINFECATGEIDEILDNYRKSFSLLNEDEIKYQNNLQKFNIKKLMGSFYGQLTFTSRSMIYKLNNPHKVIKNNSGIAALIAHADLNVILYGFLINLKKFVRLNTSKFKKPPLLPEKYFYFPLSYTNEGDGSLTRGSYNEVALIEKILKINNNKSNFVFKDHRAMIGERILDSLRFIFYSKNSTYIDSSHDHLYDSKKLINNSIGVITIAGTTGLEALMLKKPTLILGDPIYSEYFNINNTTEECSSLECKLKKFMEEPWNYISTEEECRSYLSLIMKFGLKYSYSDIINGKMSNDNEAKFFFERLMYCLTESECIDYNNDTYTNKKESY